MGVRTRRTKQDWAQEVAALMEGRYAAAERAEAMLQRPELRYTPMHGRWLNVAECELSCFTRQCLRG